MNHKFNLGDVVSYVTHTIVPMRVKCRSCKGQPTKDNGKFMCITCKGSGYVTQERKQKHTRIFTINAIGTDGQKNFYASSVLRWTQTTWYTEDSLTIVERVIGTIHDEVKG